MFGLDDREIPSLGVLVLYRYGHVVVELVDIFGHFPKNFVVVVIRVQWRCVIVGRASYGDARVDAGSGAVGFVSVEVILEERGVKVRNREQVLKNRDELVGAGCHRSIGVRIGGGWRGVIVC
jgi:hypothetical protein